MSFPYPFLLFILHPLESLTDTGINPALIVDTLNLKGCQFG